MGAPRNPFKDPEGGTDAGRMLTFMLIAAGLAVVAWLLFTRSQGALPGKYEPGAPVGQTVMTCTCRPAQ